MPDLAPDLTPDPAPDFGNAWIAAMRRGDFPAAWAVNDQVLAARDRATRDDPAEPYHRRWVWDGQPVAGRRVLVRCYHGLGDTLQFCRYLAPLRRLASHVTLEAQPELTPLLAGLPGLDHLHPFDRDAPLPPAECEIEVMELGHALRLAPDPSPYLRADPLPGPPGRVGLCWRSGGWDPARDLPPGHLRPVLALPGLSPISLQRGAARPGVPDPLGGSPDPLGGSMDLGRMASLIAGLDAVVTIDTMIAHLSAALGRPTYLLLKHDPDWRWGLPAVAGSGAAQEKPQGTPQEVSQDTSWSVPWYATVRAYRQPAPGDWGGAVGRLARDLGATLAAGEGS